MLWRGFGQRRQSTRTSKRTARAREAMFVDAESAALPDALNAADFIVIGPGLGRASWGAGLFAMVAATAAAKLIDADGLFWLAQADEMPAGDLFITPHSVARQQNYCVSMYPLSKPIDYSLHYNWRGIMDAMLC